MINLKEHFKLTAIYTLFIALPSLLQLIVLPLIEGENLMGSTDFGHLAITEAIISFVYIICLFSASSGISRFYYDYNDNPAAYNQLVSTILTGILTRGMLLLGLVVVFGSFVESYFQSPPLHNFSEYGFSLVISGINRSVIAMTVALYRNEKRVRAFVIVNLLSGIIRSSLQLVGVFFINVSFVGYVHGSALGGAIVSIGVIVYTYYNCGLHYNSTIRKSFISFTLPLLFYEIINWGMLFTDRFFLINSPGDLGVYDNAMKFAIGLQFIIQGLTSAVQPEMFRYMKEGVEKHVDKIKTLSNLFMAESVMVIIVLIIPVMLFIHFFFETDLVLSAGLISIVFVRFILRAQFQIFAMPILFAKNTKPLFYINSAALMINLFINWLLIPAYSYYGAIIAFLVSYTLQVIFTSLVQQRLMPIAWNKTKLIIFPLGIISCAILLEIGKQILDVNPFIAASMLILLTISGLVWIYRLELKKYSSKFVNL